MNKEEENPFTTDLHEQVCIFFEIGQSSCSCHFTTILCLLFDSQEEKRDEQQVEFVQNELRKNAYSLLFSFIFQNEITFLNQQYQVCFYLKNDHKCSILMNKLFQSEIQTIKDNYESKLEVLTNQLNLYVFVSFLFNFTIHIHRKESFSNITKN